MKRNIVQSLLMLFVLVVAGVSIVYGQDECTVDCLAGIPDADILAYPAPNVQQLYPDDTLLYDRLYQRVNRAIDIYDTPNGNIIRTLDAGFNFVTTQGSQDEWTLINPDQWVRTEALNPVMPSRFAGVFMPDEELPYTFGWILWNVVPSRTPGAEPTTGDLALLRYTLVNLYANVDIEGWRWYQVGVDKWVHQTLIGKYIPVERPAEVDTEKWVSVDLYEQVAIAYENDKPIFVTLISSGLSEWPTNEGMFHVYVRYPRTIMSGAQGREDFYYLEEVPWTQYFDNDIGLHGTYWHDGFGYRRSHGCVNLSITDSHWLFNWAASEIDFDVPGDTGAAVYVYSSGDYR